MAVASAVSPTGALLAARHGAGMLSLAAADPAGFAALDTNWAAHERACAESGRTADRAGWRLVTPVHLAETREEALRRAEFGTPDLVAYVEALGGARLDGCATPADAVRRWTEEGLPTSGRPEASCAGDAFQGPVTPDADTGGVEASANMVNGPLRCEGNSPGPLVSGTAGTGPRSGQCRRP
ncbi:hypothetical protein QEZ40_003539 [Streptomyces katrae]|uniref:Uncharacterized protein n=1 Tax=Streptomyces katrae TaxID=68223 RepID=A0ABT7GMU3_9ACTN|nr:hypothetical protein [Streptomyces katrae]MDK9494902.1 hypothetical protein [Streptomyces katrae]